MWVLHVKLHVRPFTGERSVVPNKGRLVRCTHTWRCVVGSERWGAHVVTSCVCKSAECPLYMAMHADALDPACLVLDGHISPVVHCVMFERAVSSSP